uniref:Uncharacterized protein n=1 Tax=viral metagenome TaxID=1070528 RepID=A0A6M3JZI6_9ZZZZ
MIELILEWKRSADKYQKLGRKEDHDPVRQEGLLCRSEVYNYCASKLEERLQQGSRVDRAAERKSKADDLFDENPNENLSGW